MNYKKFSKLVVYIALIVPVSMNSALAENLRVAGSSTVFPFATVVSEQISHRTQAAPIIESTGSGSGLRSICKKDVHIANSSRRITVRELEACLANDINLIEFWVGRDGIVLAASQKNEIIKDISLKQLYLILAKEIFVDGKLVANPYKTWRDFSVKLPNVAISIYGPPPTSGTRDALQSLVLEQAALEIPEMASLRIHDPAKFKALAHTIRDDGIYVEGGESDNLFVRKLTNDQKSLGIMGFSYLDNNRNAIRGVTIDGIAPTFENILAGTYTIIRPLYFYVRADALKGKNRNKDLKRYLRAFVSKRAIGPVGYLTDKGLIPMSGDEIFIEREKISDPVILTVEMLR